MPPSKSPRKGTKKPPAPVPPKKKPKKTVGGDEAPAENCGLCSLVDQTITGEIKPGLLGAAGGSPMLYNGYPAAGGPWIPAFQPNGTIVWINGGGL
jgi:hypothetical protein